MKSVATAFFVRAGASAFVLPCALTLLSCTGGPFDVDARIDRQAVRLVERRQDPEFNEAMASDPTVSPSLEARDAYWPSTSQRRPHTSNPRSADLPARPAPGGSFRDSTAPDDDGQAGAGEGDVDEEDALTDAGQSNANQSNTDQSVASTDASGAPGEPVTAPGPQAGSQPEDQTAARDETAAASSAEADDADADSVSVADAMADLMPDFGEQPDADTVELDLNGALAYAIAHSRDYRTERERLYLAAISLLSEKHLWGPRFFHTVTAQASGTPDTGAFDQAFELINELGVTQRLPYGGEVSARALVNYVDMLNDVPGGQSDGQTSSVVLSASMPLLRGAGEVAREDLIQAERDLTYAVRSFERFRRSFLLDISRRYFELMRLQAQLGNLERQAGNFRWLSERIEALAAAGREPYFEVQRASQQELFARNNLLNAQESYASALDTFKIALGMPVDQQILILPSEIVIPEPALNTSEAIQTATQLRLDLQTSFDQVDDARRRVRVARNRNLPELDLFTNLTFRTDQSERYGGLNFETEDSSYVAGLRFRTPLDRRLERLSARRALIELERAERSFGLARDRVRSEVRASVREIQQARFTLELQSRNIDINRTRLRGVLLRLRSLGPRDFIEAEEDLLEALNRRDTALRDLRVSILEFLLATGQMRVRPDGQWMPPGRLAEALDPDRPAGARAMIRSDRAGEAPDATAPGAGISDEDLTQLLDTPEAEVDGPRLPGSERESAD